MYSVIRILKLEMKEKRDLASKNCFTDLNLYINHYINIDVASFRMNGSDQTRYYIFENNKEQCFQLNEEG